MRMSNRKFWSIFWLLIVFAAIATAWFLGNLLYTVFWKVLGDWGFPITEAQMTAYIAANLVPFLGVLLIGALLSILIRKQIAAAGSGHREPVDARLVGAGPHTGDVEPFLRAASERFAANFFGQQRPIEIKYGEDGPFERLLDASMSRLDRMLLIEFRNPHPHTTLTNCKVEITNIEPFMGVRRPLILRDNFTLAGGDHVFIPFVTYGESRTADRAVVADTAIAVCAPEGHDPHFLAALPHDVENVLTLRGTAIGAAYCEEKVVVWAGAGTRLRIRKYESASGKPEYIALEDATREAYGSVRKTDIGLSAEKLNSNGVLAWFAHYYHDHEIPIYGNVRNSTRVEPVLFRNIDVKMEDGKLIAQEIYGDVIWENMQVTNSDHGRLLKYLRDHARALKDG
jgi:hypothetical protein